MFGADDILACRLGDLVMARQKIELAAEEAEELSRRARATKVSVRDRRRAEIIVLSAQGLTQQRIAEQLGISRWPRATKIPSATFGKPRAKTSCARSMLPDRRSP